jgi:hypothetical protein
MGHFKLDLDIVLKISIGNLMKISHSRMPLSARGRHFTETSVFSGAKPRQASYKDMLRGIVLPDAATLV